MLREAGTVRHSEEQMTSKLVFRQAADATRIRSVDNLCRAECVANSKLVFCQATTADDTNHELRVAACCTPFKCRFHVPFFLLMALHPDNVPSCEPPPPEPPPCWMFLKNHALRLHAKAILVAATEAIRIVALISPSALIFRGITLQ